MTDSLFLLFIGFSSSLFFQATVSKKDIFVPNRDIHILLKRCAAGLIDYLVILIYAVFLFLVFSRFSLPFNFNNSIYEPIFGQLLGFTTLTLPVFIYFYLSEKYCVPGTLGKQVMKLKVVRQDSSKGPALFYRNFLKFLPWEIAHTGVHWLFYYNNQALNIPVWVWVALITPQVLALVYLVSIAVSKGESSVYDRLSNTKVSLV